MRRDKKIMTTLFQKHQSHRFSSILILLGLLVGSAAPVATPPEAPKYVVKTIVIDPGHGGEEPGAVGAMSKEKDIVLKIGLLLGKMIQEELPGVKVLYTRTTDVRVDLIKRAQLANDNKADLFLSLHVNSVPFKTVRQKNKAGKIVRVRAQNKTVKGTETLLSGFNRLGESDAAARENASILFEQNVEENYDGYDPNDPESFIIFSLMKNQYREQSFKFASLIQDEFIKNNKPSRGVKEQSLLVLARTAMPAVLTELGFISNPDEEKYMNSEAGQQQIARELLNAIKAYKKSIEK